MFRVVLVALRSFGWAVKRLSRQKKKNVFQFHFSEHQRRRGRSFVHSETANVFHAKIISYTQKFTLNFVLDCASLPPKSPWWLLQPVQQQSSSLFVHLTHSLRLAFTVISSRTVSSELTLNIFALLTHVANKSKQPFLHSSCNLFAALFECKMAIFVYIFIISPMFVCSDSNRGENPSEGRKKMENMENFSFHAVALSVIIS